MNSNATMKSFNALPMEMILHIFRYLGHTDRQAAGATCKLLYAALCYPEMNTNVMITFSDIRLSDDDERVRSFIASKRPINTLAFEYITLGDASVFFQKISTLARCVTLNSPRINGNEFRKIIRQLKNLESLTVSDIYVSYGEYALGADIEYDNIVANIKSLSINSVDISFHRIIESIHRLEGFGLPYDADMCFSNIPNYECESDNLCSSYSKFSLNLLVPHLPSLRELDLRETSITSADLVKLNELSAGRLNLQVLRLENCRFLETSLYTFLKTQPNLLCVNLSSTYINDDCIKVITDNLPLLEDLNICDNQKITDTGAVTLTKLKYLKRLNVSGCNLIGGEGLRHGIAAQENNSLRYLALRVVPQFIDSIDALSKNLKSLRILDISYNWDAVNDKVVQTIIEYMPQLIELHLNECRNITDTALTGISKEKLQLMEQGQAVDVNEREGFSIENLRGLQVLEIFGCVNITDFSLEYGLKLKDLRKLDLSVCHKTTPAGINSLVQHACAIETLSLSHCDNVNDDVIQNLCKYLKRLKFLNVKACENLTERALILIKENCANLQDLFITSSSKSLENAIKHLRTQNITFKIH